MYRNGVTYRTSREVRVPVPEGGEFVLSHGTSVVVDSPALAQRHGTGVRVFLKNTPSRVFTLTWDEVNRVGLTLA